MSQVHPDWYRLRDAMEQGDPDTGVALLKQHPGLLDERNGIGETVLHFLAVENNLPAVQWLHAQGADLNATNKFGTPLLFEAASLGSRELCVWLLEHGASPHQTNAYGNDLEAYLVEHNYHKMIAFLKPFLVRG